MLAAALTADRLVTRDSRACNCNVAPRDPPPPAADRAIVPRQEAGSSLFLRPGSGAGAGAGDEPHVIAAETRNTNTMNETTCLSTSCTSLLYFV